MPFSAITIARAAGMASAPACEAIRETATGCTQGTIRNLRARRVVEIKRLIPVPGVGLGWIADLRQPPGERLGRAGSGSLPDQLSLGLRSPRCDRNGIERVPSRSRLYAQRAQRQATARLTTADRRGAPRPRCSRSPRSIAVRSWRGHGGRGGDRWGGAGDGVDHPDFLLGWQNSKRLHRSAHSAREGATTRSPAAAAATSTTIWCLCGNREFVGHLTANWGPIDGFRPANTGLEG